jgi:acetylornithine aminotransferase
MSDNLMHTYRRLPVAFTQGHGAYLEDSNGKRYLDALTGLAVCGLGHAHPAVTAAISAQAGRLLHTSNLYEIPSQDRLAERLCEMSGMDRVFFANSGAEANEAAIKLARLYGNQQNISRPAVIAADQSFHGRTMATLTATGNRKVHAGFEPLLSGFVRAPYNDIESLETIAANNNDVVAVMIEPVQGEGGINIPADDYLVKVRQICDQQNWLMILDEVQSGNGRTGKFFAYQHTDIAPDIVTTAKGLGNGVPIGACLAKGAAAELFQPGHHGSTFGGNPLACAAAHAVLDTLQGERLIERAGEVGERILADLGKALAGNNGVAEIRGKGLMIAIEMNEACGDLVTKGLEQGILINVAADKVIRLLPPLNLTDDEADELVEKVAALVNG